MSRKENTTAKAKASPEKRVEFFPAKQTTSNKPVSGVEVGGGFSVGGLSMRRLLAMAAISPEDSQDPVDLALKESLRYLFRHGAPNTDISSDDFAPPQERRYSLARVHEFQRTKDDPAQKTIIIRGDLESVMNVAKPSRQNRTLLRKNAQMAGSRGYRCLGVASATVDEDGQRGPFHMEGFVNVRPVGTGLQGEDLTPTSDDWVRLELWSASLRFLHWFNVVIIVALSVTGYYIMDPFFGDTFFRGIETGYLMGWMRFIHFACGFTWIAVGLARACIAFISKDRYMRWETFWPLHSKEDVKNLGKVLGFYTFLRKEGPLYVAHNPLQQLTYTSIYVVGAFQMLIGLSLYALYHMSNPIWAFIALPCSWFGVPNIRLAHAMVMFVFWWFVIAHIYLALRADSLERHGGVSAMISGGVWMRRTSRPLDAPEL